MFFFHAFDSLSLPDHIVASICIPEKEEAKLESFKKNCDENGAFAKVTDVLPH